MVEKGTYMTDLHRSQTNKKKLIETVVVIGVFFLMITACGHDTDKKQEEVVIMQEPPAKGMIEYPQSLQKKNTYDTLNVATYITKIDGIYFIVDCYHNQIIYHDNLSDPLNQWNVLTDEVHYAHTIVSDGTILLVDDTENNRLLVFQQLADGYVHTQTLDNIGMKPHYVQYDANREQFMAWSSITGELYLLRRSKQADEKGIYSLSIENILQIEELYGVYVRSFTLIKDEIYFVSGHNNQKIIKAVINEQDQIDIVAEYQVPPAIAGMVQLTRIGEYYYITISTDNQENQDYATIIRTKELEELETGAYEDIYDMFGVQGGTPYYITEIEGKYYMAHHRTTENIIAFDVEENQIKNVSILY